MNWKEFLKPSSGKITLILLLSVLITVLFLAIKSPVMVMPYLELISSIPITSALFFISAFIGSAIFLVERLKLYKANKKTETSLNIIYMIEMSGFIILLMVTSEVFAFTTSTEHYVSWSMIVIKIIIFYILSCIISWFYFSLIKRK